MATATNFLSRFAIILIIATILASCKGDPATTSTNGVVDVKMYDAFWGPRFDTWRTVTVNDVFDKFEGKYDPKTSTTLTSDFEKMKVTRNAFQNFDLVAEGKRGIGLHNGPPWYDGLVYE